MCLIARLLVCHAVLEVGSTTCTGRAAGDVSRRVLKADTSRASRVARQQTVYAHPIALSRTAKSRRGGASHQAISCVVSRDSGQGNHAASQATHDTENARVVCDFLRVASVLCTCHSVAKSHVYTVGREKNI